MPKTSSAALAGCLAGCFPLRRFEIETAFLRHVTATAAASHEVVLLFRVLFVSSYRARWVSSTPPRPSCFQVTRAAFRATPAPVPLRERVHPLLSFASSPEYGAISDPLDGLDRPTPSLGFPAPSRQQYWESTSRRASLSRLRSALSVSHALDGLLLPVPGGLVSSHTPRASFALQGFSPTLSRPGSSPARSLLTF